jgi:hypothetical protein
MSTETGNPYQTNRHGVKCTPTHAASCDDVAHSLLLLSRQRCVALLSWGRTKLDDNNPDIDAELHTCSGYPRRWQPG